MLLGQRVEVQEAFDVKGVKVVVSEDDRNLYVCREDEYRRAGMEKREPVCVGFRREFVVKVLNEG